MDLEELAKAAEMRRANNESIGPPPSPAVQTKRRYEAVPSAASPQGRPLPDQHYAEPEQPAIPMKASYTDDFPSNAVQRSLTGDLVAKGRSGRDALQDPLMVQPKLEDPRRPAGLAHKPLVGPRSGFFRDESPAFSMSHQARSRDNSPHQHPLRPGDHRLGELGHNIPAGSPRQLNLGPPREPLGFGAHLPTSVPISATNVQNDRFGVHQPHSRNGSIGHVPPTTLEPARDLAALRQVEPLQSSRYSMIPPPTATPPPMSSIASLRRTESGPGINSASPVEPPKPAAPAKRSNIASLLNDEPSEPKPVKRSSFDSQKRASMMSPQTMPHHGSPFEPSRNAFRLDGSPADLDRNIRTPLGSLGPTPLREQQQAAYPSQTPGPSDDWMQRYDPRPQSALAESRSLHQSPRPAHYSLLPPTSGSSLRMEAPRPVDPAQDHRRLLSSLSHPGSNPSPPPQQTMSSYRGLPGSSQPVHSRVSSVAFPHSQTSQAQQHPLQHPAAGGPGHPSSAGSTPVSSLHHHRPSQDHSSQLQRQTIQQHMATQHMAHMQQQRDPPSMFREREHEQQALQRQREMEAQQQLRGPDRDRDMFGGFRRDLLGYGGGPSREQENQPSHGHHHHAHQPSQSQPGPRGFGFQPEPVQRSFTPQPLQPQSLQPQHPPYAPSHTPGPPSQIHHHHHLQGGQPKPAQIGPPPPPGVHATNHGTYGHGQGHFRLGDDRRYE
jgi:hypothetical protein